MKRLRNKQSKVQSSALAQPAPLSLPWFFPAPDSMWINKLLDDKTERFDIDNGTILDFLASSLVSSSTDSTGVVSLLISRLLWSEDTLLQIQQNEKQRAFLSSIVSVADVKQLASHLNPSFVAKLLTLFKTKRSINK